MHVGAQEQAAFGGGAYHQGWPQPVQSMQQPFFEASGWSPGGTATDGYVPYAQPGMQTMQPLQPVQPVMSCWSTPAAAQCGSCGTVFS